MKINSASLTRRLNAAVSLQKIDSSSAPTISTYDDDSNENGDDATDIDHYHNHHDDDSKSRILLDRPVRIAMKRNAERNIRTLLPSGYLLASSSSISRRRTGHSGSKISCTSSSASARDRSRSRVVVGKKWLWLWWL